MKKYEINLIPKQKKTLLGKLMFFLLHYFRYIIVLTQIVVISVFFARFSLDQEIVDLKESFTDKQAILEITKPLIDEAEAYVAKQDNAKEILNLQNSFMDDFNYVLSIVPQDITLTSLQKSSGSIQMKGKSSTILSIKRLFIKLVKDARFANVKVIELSGSSDVGYIFGLEMIQKI